ncbi:MAG: bifunctional DNA-binding transcriptional regulator/O6-methylguanine-DNA methyltransferase Ada [Gemmatimonadaceae bacterium]
MSIKTHSRTIHRTADPEARTTADGANDPVAAWAAVESRDRRWDGVLVYAVRSTGIYCRPSCPSRRPRRDRVAFFPTARAAEAGGYRACLRCQPSLPPDQTGDDGMARICAYIDAHVGEPLALATLASVAGLSVYHFHRRFRAAVGVSPKHYVDARRVGHLKTRLRRGDTVSRAAYEAGFGSGSSAYTHAAALGMSPGEYRRGGRGVVISYVISDATDGIGRLLVAATDAGLASVAIGDDAATLTTELRAEYPAASLVGERDMPRDTRDRLHRWAEALSRGLHSGRGAEGLPPLVAGGTPFQRQVWDALRAIPSGTTRTYSDVARTIGRPRAVRAVAGACAANHLAIVIPCHRVVRSDGALGGYRWGVARKTELLRVEAMVASPASRSPIAATPGERPAPDRVQSAAPRSGRSRAAARRS